MYMLCMSVVMCVKMRVCILVTKIPSISFGLNTLISSMEGSNKFTAGDECRTVL